MLNLDGLELSEEQTAKLKELNKGLVPESEIEGLKKNRDDLLAEKKAASEAKRLAEEETEAARLQALEENKNHKELAESYKAKLAELEERDKVRAQELAESQKRDKALEVARAIADGPNAEILARFVGDRLRVVDGEYKVTDEQGNLTISTLEELTNEFKANKAFASLVKVTNASGGGATTNGGASGTTNTKPVSEMTPTERESVRKQGIEGRLRQNGLIN